MKVLLVDDDTELLDITTYALHKHGFNVVTVTDGAQAMRRWETEQPDIVLLDVGLPRLDGFEVCRKIRERSSTPIIMVSARGDDDHVVKGFLLGADDYVTKPFSHRQLAARIRYLLNRQVGSTTPEPLGQLQAGNLVLDLSSHEATHGEVTVRLTPLEFRILYMLAVNEGRVVSSARLVEYAWGYRGGDVGTLKVHICNIRQKLRLRRDQPGYIAAIPWVGYSLTRDGTGA